jgi:hypothetical protein
MTPAAGGGGGLGLGAPGAAAAADGWDEDFEEMDDAAEIEVSLLAGCAAGLGWQVRCKVLYVGVTLRARVGCSLC